MIDENPKGGTTLNDLRAQLPECPLEYQIPHIPGSHTALVIEINTADIDWQEKMLPWTLASLINNTDIVMKGVHLYVVCEDGETQDRIKTALKKFDLPPGTITQKDEDSKPLTVFGKYGYRYDSYCRLDINYWAFRGIGKREEATITLRGRRNTRSGTSCDITMVGALPITASIPRTTSFRKTLGYGCLNRGPHPLLGRGEISPVVIPQRSDKDSQTTS